MSSVSKGKKYERDVCTRLRDKGFKAERIRGSGGGTGTRSGDILFVESSDWPDGVEHAKETRGTDRQGLTIERAYEQGQLDDAQVFDGEVKYQNDGFSRVYTEQWRHGQGTVVPWQDHVLSCGIGVFDQPSVLCQAGVHETVCQGVAGELNELTKKTQRIMRGSGTAKAPDFVFVRRSKKDLGPVDWVVLWQCEGSNE